MPEYYVFNGRYPAQESSGSAKAPATVNVDGPDYGNPRQTHDTYLPRDRKDMKVDAQHAREVPKDDRQVSNREALWFVATWLGTSLLFFSLLVLFPFEIDAPTDPNDSVSAILYLIVPGEFTSLLGIVRGIILFIVISAFVLYHLAECWFRR